jgi:hypothetical protein
MTNDPRFQTILRADAALCLACGLPGLLAPTWLAAFLLPGQSALFGLSMPTVMLELGILLAAYAGLLLFISTRQAVPRIVMATTALADAGWVLGTVALLAAFGAGFSLWGTVALALVALDTVLMGLWKLRALRRTAQSYAAA